MRLTWRLTIALVYRRKAIGRSCGVKALKIAPGTPIPLASNKLGKLPILVGAHLTFADVRRSSPAFNDTRPRLLEAIVTFSALAGLTAKMTTAKVKESENAHFRAIGRLRIFELLSDGFVVGSVRLLRFCRDRIKQRLEMNLYGVVQCTDFIVLMCTA